MELLKINTYTKILKNGNKSFTEQKKLINTNSISKSSDFIVGKNAKKRGDKLKAYQQFVSKTFSEKRFIGSKEFNRLLIEKFNSSSTYHRHRMIKIGLITEKNKLIKPAI